LCVDAGVYGLENVIGEVFEGHPFRQFDCPRDTIIRGDLTMQ
jgi:hypothetical protein